MKTLYGFKMAAKKRASLRKNSHVNKIWKTTFPKEFLNKISHKVAENEYIYIFEIQFTLF